MSLTKVHPLLDTAGHSSYQVAKSLIQSIMLSGRYRCGALLRHWKRDYDGRCLLSPNCGDQIEDITHIVQRCPALCELRKNLLTFTYNYTLSLPLPLHQLFLELSNPLSSSFCQFLLDCASIPLVIAAMQEFGSRFVLNIAFFISRTWVYAIHRERLKILGQWKHRSSL